MIGPALQRRSGHSTESNTLPSTKEHSNEWHHNRMAIIDDAEPPDHRNQAVQKKKTVVLVPLDFSISSRQAVDFGIKIARDSDGLLLLAHVVDLTLTPYGPAVRARMDAELCRDAMAKAEPLLIAAREAGVKAICTVESGLTASV